VFGAIAVAWMLALAVLTIPVHFVDLTVTSAVDRASPTLRYVLGFEWPSVAISPFVPVAQPRLSRGAAGGVRVASLGPCDLDVIRSRSASLHGYRVQSAAKKRQPSQTSGITRVG
jgi:hypothetical protein